jgi:5-bromo-4-chloroindolyl phosphate hydrolysis protein
MEQQTITVAWTTLGTIFLIFTGVVGAATVYLKMSMQVVEKNILEKVENKFASKERSLEKERDQDHRLTRLETAVFQSVFQKGE